MEHLSPAAAPPSAHSSFRALVSQGDADATRDASGAIGAGLTVSNASASLPLIASDDMPGSRQAEPGTTGFPLLRVDSFDGWSSAHQTWADQQPIIDALRVPEFRPRTPGEVLLGSPAVARRLNILDVCQARYAHLLAVAGEHAELCAAHAQVLDSLAAVQREIGSTNLNKEMRLNDQAQALRQRDRAETDREVSNRELATQLTGFLNQLPHWNAAEAAQRAQLAALEQDAQEHLGQAVQLLAEAGARLAQARDVEQLQRQCSERAYALLGRLETALQQVNSESMELSELREGLELQHEELRLGFERLAADEQAQAQRRRALERTEQELDAKVKVALDGIAWKTQGRRR